MAQITYRLNRPRKGKNKPLVEHPVSILACLSVNSEVRPEISTGETIIPKHWDFKKQRAKTSAPAFAEINDNLNRIERELKQFWRDNIADLSKINSQAITPIVRGKSSTEVKKKIFEALTKFLTAWRKDKKKGTMSRYNAMESRLYEFDVYNESLPVSQRINFDLSGMDMNFYHAFKSFLYELPVKLVFKDGIQQFHKNGKPKLNFPNLTYSYHKLVEVEGIWTAVKDMDFRFGIDKPVPLMDDTVFKYLSNIQTFLRFCVKSGYQVNPVFETWEIIERVHPPIPLTEPELIQLESTTFEKQIAIGADYLICESRTGARISDLKLFDLAQVQMRLWTYYTEKGNRMHRCKAVLPFTGFSLNAWWTLQKYGFKLPNLSEQKINKGIKKACKQAGINQQIFIERWSGNKLIRIYGEKWEFISSHTGRKTFITILANVYQVPLKIIMQYTGIKDIKTIMHYLSESETQVLEDHMDRAGEGKSIMKKAN